MPWRAMPLPFELGGRPVTGRIRAAVSAALLLVVMGASACSLQPSSPGRSLPISVTSSPRSVQPTKCTLNLSGTQAIATGKCLSLLAPLPVVAGQQVGALHLQLSVISSKNLRVGNLLVRNPRVGEAVWGGADGADHLAARDTD